MIMSDTKVLKLVPKSKLKLAEVQAVASEEKQRSPSTWLAKA
jgi:hypothetical protein